tara:strand:- start:203 stop:445 length:243 start_codon:yes stop_codon:yes gene_type:complete
MELTEENVNVGIDYMQPFTKAHGRSMQLVEIVSNTIKVRFTETGDKRYPVSSMTIERVLELVESYFKTEYPDCSEVVQVL